MVQSELDTISVKPHTNLLPLLKNGNLSDFKVISSNGKEYHAHKAILAAKSEYFAKMFESNLIEATNGECQLEYPDPESIFDAIIKYMYGETLDINEQNLGPLLEQANYYQITSLSDDISHIINEIMNEKNFFKIYRQAVKFSAESLAKKCSEFLAENFESYDWEDSDRNLNFLPVDYLIDLIQERIVNNNFAAEHYRQSLATSNWSFYLIIERYTRKYAGNCDQIQLNEGSVKDEHPEEELDLPQLTAKDLRNLYSLVEFWLLDVGKLDMVVLNKLIPSDIIQNSLMKKLRSMVN